MMGLYSNLELYNSILEVIVSVSKRLLHLHSCEKKSRSTLAEACYIAIMEHMIVAGTENSRSCSLFRNLTRDEGAMLKRFIISSLNRPFFRKNVIISA
ncbi:hypothetical protein Hanom_Chr09g00820711 [Helianthus anomalus]